MSLPQNTLNAAANRSLSADQRRLIDRLCSRFEQDFVNAQLSSTQQHPASPKNRSMERILSDPEASSLEGETLGQLVEELLLTEFELRENSGAQVVREEFYVRFPNFHNSINAALRRYQVNKMTWASETSLWVADANDPSVRYVRQSELARGGMGIVYRGYDRMLQRTVAIKVLDAALVGDEEAFERFQREPRLCGNLQHPNVVPIYDTGVTSEGLPYFVMRLIRGHTLAELLDESRVEFASEAILVIFQQICHAIAAAHRQGIIHRDIKPSNIMVADLGEVYVMDWGLSGVAKAAEADKLEATPDVPTNIQDDTKDASLTSTGKIFGTPRYMPPEFGSQLFDRSNRRADVYCLGAVLCELLVGKTPKQIIGDDPPSRDSGDQLQGELSEAGIGQALIELVIHCVQNDPKHRPESAEHLVQVIEEYRRDTRIRARQAELDAERLRDRNRISQLRLKFVAVIAASLICIGGIGGWARNRNQLAQAERMSKAKNALANAQLAFEMACKTQKWQASEWTYSDQIFEAAVPLVEQTVDRNLLANADVLRNQKKVLGLIRQAMTVETNLKENYFYLPNQQACIEQAFHVMVGIKYGDHTAALKEQEEQDGQAAEQEVQQALAALKQLPQEARRLIAAALIGWTSSSRFPNTGNWKELVPKVEHDVFGSDVSRAVLDDDLEQLKQHAKSEELYQWPSVVVDLLALVLWNRGEIELADQVFRVAILRFPSDFQVNSNYGNLLSVRFPQTPTKALRYLATAASLDPNPGAIYNYAGCLCDSGEFEMAETVLENLVKQHPDYYSASVALAECKLALNDLNGAQQVLEHSIEQGDESPHTLLLLSELYLNSGRWNLVEEYLNRVQDMPGLNAMELSLVIKLLTQLGRINQAIDLGCDYLELHENSPSVHLLLAEAYSAKGAHEKAIELYQTLPHGGFTSVQTAIGIGDNLRRQGKFEEALVHFIRGHEFSIVHSDWKYPSMSLVRNIEDLIHRSEDLIAAFQQVQNGNDPEEMALFVQETLIPLNRWRDAYDMAAIALKDPNAKDFGTLFLLNAATAAMKTLGADSAEPPVRNDAPIRNDAQLDDALVRQIEQDLLDWLRRAASNVQLNFADPRLLAHELYVFRLFSEANYFQVFRSDNMLDCLRADTREQLKTLLAKIDVAKRKLEKSLP